MHSFSGSCLACPSMERNQHKTSAEADIIWVADYSWHSSGTDTVVCLGLVGVYQVQQW